jgi:hypothetical protein
MIPWDWIIVCWSLGLGLIVVFFMEHRKLWRLARTGDRHAVRTHPLIALESSRKGFRLSTWALVPTGIVLLVYVPIIGVFVLLGLYMPLTIVAHYWSSIVESVKAAIVEPS